MTPRAFDYLALVRVMLYASKVKPRRAKSTQGAYWAQKFCRHEALELWAALTAEERAAVDVQWHPGATEGP